jgi:hypothetical protein
LLLFRDGESEYLDSDSEEDSMANIAKLGPAVIMGVALLLAGCPPGTEQQEIEQGAIPAAPDMRPGSEVAPGGVVAPGATQDTVLGQPREPLPDQPPTAGTRN